MRAFLSLLSLHTSRAESADPVRPEVAAWGTLDAVRPAGTCFLACAVLLTSLLSGGCGSKRDSVMADREDSEATASAAVESSEESEVAEPMTDEDLEGREAAEGGTPSEMELPITAPENSAAAEAPVPRSPTSAIVEPITRGTREAGGTRRSSAEQPREVLPAPEFTPYSLPVETMAMEEEPGAAPPAASTAAAAAPPAVAGASAGDPGGLVTVFYGTDRQVVDVAAADEAIRRNLLLSVVTAAVTLLLCALGAWGWQRWFTGSLSAVGCLATLVLGGYWVSSYLQGSPQSAAGKVRYGNERGVMEYGTCQISIPASHESGEIERPSILRLEVREDVTKHVILQATNATSKETFFDRLRETVGSAERAELFVFVHGYNVTFDGAARRTAQIAHDVEFAGAPIFFSWPSQGGLLKYAVDENNAEWSVPHLKQFLLDVTRRSGAKSVNLIAHSMGNRALTRALRELRLQLGEETALFNQVILAAPDIDAEIFKRDLAPALVRSAQRVTLYASSNDQALAASKRVHGYPRAGESGRDLVVLPGIETIDVSTLDTSLLGHSYYGSSNPILLDIRRLIRDALPASQRPFLLPRSHGPLTYWVFEKIRQTATREHSWSTE